MPFGSGAGASRAHLLAQYRCVIALPRMRTTHPVSHNVGSRLARVTGLALSGTQRLDPTCDRRARRSSSVWIAERTSACTVDSSSSAACWSRRFIDFGMRTARNTTSSRASGFLTAATAGSSFAHEERDRDRGSRPLSQAGGNLAIDRSLNLRDHAIKRSGGRLAAFAASISTCHGEGVWQ